MDAPVLPYGDETLLTEREAAKYLGVEGVTLQKWRQQKVGPEHINIGPSGEHGRGVRYKFGVLRRHDTRATAA